MDVASEAWLAAWDEGGWTRGQIAYARDGAAQKLDFVKHKLWGAVQVGRFFVKYHFFQIDV